MSATTDGGDETAAVPPAEPSEAMRALDRLVGTWRVTGGAEGTVRYEWMEGRFFLVQHVDLEQSGQRVRGVECIGHLRPFAEEPSEHVRSRFYSTAGDTLDYTYEMEGDTLTVWGGEKGSPASFTGRLSADGTVLDGAWTYPGGGGYRSTMTRDAG